MAKWDPYARQKADEYGIPQGIFLALGSKESGRSQYEPDGSIKTSEAGALGWGQLMPDTAKELGVDPFDPKQNIDGAARYLSDLKKRFGSWKLALAGYNAGPSRVEDGSWRRIGETRGYVAEVLRLAGDTRQATATAAVPGTVASTAAGLPVPPPIELDFTNAALDNLAALARGGEGSDPVSLLSNLTASVAGQRAAAPPPVATSTPTPIVPAPQKGGGKPPQPPPVSGDFKWQDWVGKIEKRQGPSKPHQPEILAFVGKIGYLAQTVLTPWGNESHSLTTNKGRPSAHGPGLAADIPAQDDELIRLGRIALIAAGADKKWAMKQTGGLFNIGGYQVIFNTDIGGDHSDHLHVGIRH